MANGLLAFLEKQLYSMDEVSVIQICTSNWREEEIRSAKVLLYESLEMIDRMPSRRRDEKGERSLQDIINVFKGTDPDEWPVEFVVTSQGLHSMPPVTFDHVDVTRLLKDITTLKSSLDDLKLKFEASQTTINDLRAEIVELKTNKSVCRSITDVSNSDSCGIAIDAVQLSSASSELDPSSVNVTDRHATPRPAPRASPAPVVTNVSTPTSRAYATAASQPPKGQQSTQPRKAPALTTAPAPDPVPAKESSDNEGFIKVERKRRKPLCRNKCGTGVSGPNMLLRAAVPTTLLYVSRLHYSTKPDDLVEYMRVKTKFTLRVAKLESRHSVNFNSYVVRVPTSHLATFTQEEFWPKGVVFRRYRGRLPDTPSLCSASQDTT